MLAEPSNTIIIGRSGSGKSLRARKLIEAEPRAVIYDTLGHDYSDGVVVYSLAEYKRFMRRVHGGRFRIIYRPIDEIEELTQLSRLIYMQGNMVFLVEELDLFARPGRVPMEFLTILKRGRHRDIRFIGVTQRPIGVDRTVTSQATEINIFATHEPRDRDYLAAVCGSEIAAALDALEQYQYVRWTGTGRPLEIAKENL